MPQHKWNGVIGGFKTNWATRGQHDKTSQEEEEEEGCSHSGLFKNEK